MEYNFVVMPSFARWLLDHRKNSRMTQSEVAKKAGVSVSYVSTIERNQPHSTTGATLRPEPDKVAALAKAVNGDVNEALLSAGYASKLLTEKPRTIPELIKRFKELGLDLDDLEVQFYNNTSQEEYERAIADLSSAIEYTLLKQRRPRRMLIDLEIEADERDVESGTNEQAEVEQIDGPRDLPHRKAG